MCIRDREFAAIQTAIEEAIQAAEEEKIMGKKITPFLLAKIESLTKGKSLEANIELVLNNAKLGGELAVAYSKL